MNFGADATEKIASQTTKVIRDFMQIGARHLGNAQRAQSGPRPPRIRPADRARGGSRRPGGENHPRLGAPTKAWNLLPNDRAIGRHLPPARKRRHRGELGARQASTRFVGAMCLLSFPTIWRCAAWGASRGKTARLRSWGGSRGEVQRGGSSATHALAFMEGHNLGPFPPGPCVICPKNFFEYLEPLSELQSTY